MIRPSLLSAGLVLAGLSATPAWAQVTVDHAWSRATPPHATTGVLYFTLASPVADRLVAVSTPAARTAELHQTEAAGDVMTMRPVDDGLALPAGKAVTLRPGGTHVMLMGLTAPLTAGARVPVHLTFQSAPAVDLVATVQPLGTAAPKN